MNNKLSINDPLAIAEGRLVYLRLELSYILKELREGKNLTQKDIAERLGIKQAAISKLESPLKNHDMESILKYLAAVDGDLLVAIRQGNKLYQLSDTMDGYLVDVPEEAKDFADEHGLPLRDFVHEAIDHYDNYLLTKLPEFTAPFLEAMEHQNIMIPFKPTSDYNYSNITWIN